MDGSFAANIERLPYNSDIEKTVDSLATSFSKRNETYIVIKGFEGLNSGVFGLVVKVTDIKQILVQQDSAYDLVGE